MNILKWEQDWKYPCDFYLLYNGVRLALLNIDGTKCSGRKVRIHRHIDVLMDCVGTYKEVKDFLETATVDFLNKLLGKPNRFVMEDEDINRYAKSQDTKESI